MQIVPSRSMTTAPADRFTGDVWFDVLAAAPAPGRLRVDVVRLAPGER